MFLATFHSDFRGENFLYQLFTQLPKKNNLSQIPCLSLEKSPKTEIIIIFCLQYMKGCFRFHTFIFLNIAKFG